MDLGSKLRTLRVVREISSSELSRRSGVSQSRISEIENGHGDPSLSTLRKLATVLRVAPAVLLESDVATPFDILDHIPEDLREWMLRQKNLPWIRLNKKAAERGLTPEQVDGLINMLDKIRKNEL